MSTSWLKAEQPSLPAELLARLRGQDNPFDDFVQSRRPGGSFHRRHVAAVNRDVFEKLQSVLNRYRLEAEGADTRLLTLDDVPRSGVLLVLGPRGAGKTHLVHALQLHETGAHVIAPNQFEPHRPFAEYLLQLVVGSLQGEAQAAGPAILWSLADWLARRVAVQALYGMTDTQWLARQTVHDGVYWRRLFGWGSQALADRRELLIKSLLEPTCRTLHDACRVREYPVDDLRRMALRQIDESETSSTIGGQIRRGLHVQLVKLAFDADADPLLEFLLDGFTQVDAPLAPSRETMVEELLGALTELFFLFGRPLAFAFDALETLLSDPPDEQKCHAFFRGLAEVLDSHRGLPLLVFAEAGHWEQAQRYLSSYAQQRMQQGVPTRGHGSLRLLSLPPVTAHDLEQLVAARLTGLLASADGQPASQTPLGPFCREDLVEIARDGTDAPPLRQMLQALRDLYQERVFGDGGQAGLATDDEREPAGANGRVRIDLKEIWLREHKVSLRRIESEGIESQAGPLQLGLQRWLECQALHGASTGGWTPSRSEILTFGTSPAFGQLTRCRWQAEAQACEMGISFLLGQRSNMPRDLKEKLRMMASSRPVVPALLILWPHLLECAGPAEKHLPTATRKVWDDLVAGPLAARVWLRSVDPHALAVWLAVGPWEAAVREEGFKNVAAMQRFLAEETGDLLPLITPQEDSQHACVAAC